MIAHTEREHGEHTALRQILRKEDGVGIIWTVLLGAVIFMMTGIMFTRSSSGLNQSQWDRNWQRSLHVAEAGIDHVLYTLTNDDTWDSSDTLPPSFGSSDAEKTWVLSTAAASSNLVEVSEGDWVIIKPTSGERIYAVGYVPSRATAQNTRVIRVVYDFAPFSPGAAFVTDGNLSINGNPTFSGTEGSAHANGDIIVVGVPDFTGSLSSSGSYTPGGATIGDPDGSGGGMPTVQIPDVDPTELFYLAEYVFCADGNVYTGPAYAAGPEVVPGPSDPPCSGTLLADASTSEYRGWRKTGSSTSQGAQWAYGGNDRYDGVYYIDAGSASISGSPGDGTDPWNVTILAAAQSAFSSCSTIVGGDVIITGNPAMRSHEKGQPFIIVARRDVILAGVPSSNVNYSGVVAAYEQIRIGGTPSIFGAIMVNDACDTPGSPVSQTEIIGNASITYDANAEIPLGHNIRITHWNEL